MRPHALIAACLVSILAIAIRIPSCWQSFWVDELHTTWCIWDSLGDVSQRAAIGNQSPVYFWGLWIWKQAIGESEITLRMTSVLATALAGGYLTYGIARTSHSTCAGATAGFVLAFESNSIFFGTELRPYALVILGASVAIVSVQQSWNHREAQTDRSAIPFVIAMVGSSVVHVTSLAVFAFLAILLGFPHRERYLAMVRSNPRVTALAFSSLLVAGLAFWFVMIRRTWSIREQWGSFARAPELTDAFQIWHWQWLWAVPLVIAIACIIHDTRRGAFRPDLRLVLGLGLACFLVMTIFWFASRMNYIHLWHRRYFVGLLPVFATMIGLAVGQISIRDSRTESQSRGSWRSSPVGTVVQYVAAIAIVVGLANSQKVLPMALKNPQWLAYRGEDWRSAVRYASDVQRQKSADLPIDQSPDNPRWLIDSGLIEADALLATEFSSAKRRNLVRDYLCCPVLGPYSIEGAAASSLQPVTQQTLGKWYDRVFPNQESPTRSIQDQPNRQSDLANQAVLGAMTRQRLPISEATASESQSKISSHGSVSVMITVPD